MGSLTRGGRPLITAVTIFAAIAIALAGCEPMDGDADKRDPNKPSFGRSRVQDQTAYVAGVVIPRLSLPRATDGDGTLTYRLTPVPRGLSFDARSRTLSGVPAAPGRHLLKYRVEDADGDAAELSFRIEAKPLTTMYWTGYSRIQRGAMSGGTVEDLVTSDPTIIAVVVDAEQRVYWSEGGFSTGGKIRRANRDGSGAADIVTTQGVYALALDQTNEKLFWGETDTDTGASKIRRANLDGTGAEDVVSTPASVISIALDFTNEKLFWGETDTDTGASKIRRANLDGTSAEDIVSTPAGVSEIALDLTSEKLLWAEIDTDTDTDTDTGAGKIRRANLDGSDTQDVITTAVAVLGIALDVRNQHLYWAESDFSGGKIQRTNLDRSSEEVIATHVGRVFRIALDLTNQKLYWTEILNSAYSKVVRADLNGSQPEDVVVNRLREFTGAIALDVLDGKMYWTEVELDVAQRQRRYGVRRADLDGGAEEHLFTISDEPVQFEFDIVERKLYWIERERAAHLLPVGPDEPPVKAPAARIMRANVNGSGMEELATIPSYNHKIEIDPVERKLYWIDKTERESSIATVIRRANLDGTASEIVVDDHNNSLAIDIVGRKLYWNHYGEEGGVWRANLDGSASEVAIDRSDLPDENIELQAVDGSNRKMYYTIGWQEVGRADLDGSAADVIVTLEEGSQSLVLGVR